ncbi:MAG: hypothetical protein RBT80_00750 [Candidatus Vecturithrix sp.]|jgi:hypothetical protein|nr:hypothetical protein [Candidatus Vecturithrix sp.]
MLASLLFTKIEQREKRKEEKNRMARSQKLRILWIVLSILLLILLSIVFSRILERHLFTAIGAYWILYFLHSIGAIILFVPIGCIMGLILFIWKALGRKVFMPIKQLGGWGCLLVCLCYYFIAGLVSWPVENIWNEVIQGRYHYSYDYTLGFFPFCPLYGGYTFVLVGEKWVAQDPELVYNGIPYSFDAKPGAIDLPDRTIYIIWAFLSFGVHMVTFICVKFLMTFEKKTAT